MARAASRPWLIRCRASTSCYPPRAAFIGAATFRFGEFNIFGTVVGVLINMITANGLILLGVPNYTTYIFQGAILLVALIFARVVALKRVG
jgi:ribose transport system permease protein